MMRYFIKAAVAVIGLTLGFGHFAMADDARKPTKIHFGYQLSQTGFLVANELGWFKDEFAKDGIAFDARLFVSGPPIIEAFASNHLDFGLTGDQPALLARANNIALKAVGVPVSGGKGLALVVPADSPVKSVADLKGKKIGVTVGSVGQHFLYLLLKREGLKPSDIQLVNLQQPDIKLALEQKNIDAGVPWEPWISLLEIDGTARVVSDAAGLKQNANVILVTEQFAKDYPDIVERVLKVFLRAEKFIAENPERASAIAAKATGYKLEVAARFVPRNNYDVRLTKEVIDSFRETALFLRENNVLRKDVNIDDFVDTSYLRRIGAQ